MGGGLIARARCQRNLAGSKWLEMPFALSRVQTAEGGFIFLSTAGCDIRDIKASISVLTATGIVNCGVVVLN